MKRARGTLVAVLVVGLMGFFLFRILRPSPVPVDVARVERGTLQVTVDEEGKTRVRERFVIAAPVAGRLDRITLDEGDPVKPGTVLAHLHPAPLDPRSRAEANARLEAAEAARLEAAATAQKARAALGQAARNEERARRLAEAGTLSKQAREDAELERTTRARELEAALFAVRAADFQTQAARATLMEAGEEPEGAGALVNACGENIRGCLELRSPVSGRVLRLFEESQRVVPAGAPLVEVGDPAAIEILVDLLSTDAVKVRPGQPVIVERWGGEEALRARVRRIEPAGFTKLSALGVEEQRVNVVADFVDPPGSLGDGYRLEARIVVWEGTDVLMIPSSAIFRRGDGWSVFVVESGRARRREVAVGHLAARVAEVRSGLTPGEKVILHPGDRIEERVRVRPLTP